MVMNPASLEAKSARSARAYAPWQESRTAAFRTVVEVTKKCINAFEHEFRQIGASATCCKVCSDPTPEESAVAGSGLMELLKGMGNGSWSEEEY